MITTSSAFALPIAAISVLSAIRNFFHRLSAIAAFTLTFASLPMSLTERILIRVFTATATRAPFFFLTRSRLMIELTLALFASRFLAMLVIFTPVETD